MKWDEFREDVRGTIGVPNRRTIFRIVLLVTAFLILVLLGLAILQYVFPGADEAAERLAEDYSNHAYLVVFLLTLVGSATIFLPAPNMGIVILLISLLDLNPGWVAVVAAIGGSLGEISGYIAGYLGRAVIAPEHTERYQTAEKWMHRYGGWGIAVFAFCPFLIFDLAGIAGGALKYPVGRFLLFCFIGRLPRSFIECYLGASLMDLVLDIVGF